MSGLKSKVTSKSSSVGLLAALEKSNLARMEIRSSPGKRGPFREILARKGIPSSTSSNFAIKILGCRGNSVVVVNEELLTHLVPTTGGLGMSLLADCIF